MNNYNIEYIIKIFLNILIVSLIIYVVARLFIFLLPVIIIAILLYYVYKIYVETKNRMKVKKNDNQKNKIVEADIISERFDK